MQTGSLVTIALGLASAAVAAPPPWAPAWGYSSQSSSVVPTSSVVSSTPVPTVSVTPSGFTSSPLPSGTPTTPCPYPSGFPLPSDAPFSVPPPFQGSAACPPWGPPSSTALPSQ
ncbi:hypothetical protein N7532_001502 [Penicillium argentinense]|uniref:Uncharacterized protein n=1 Tax=Penicillium argentinense TaxID=1131581 RepID=A0A9W9G2Q7_9EURO|nr:uncharacterized protein N7532_001502 [Penicillium argentinense]KAJ5110967.1 hypothetical protein N7532_001502 [Penicillium argentinense]